MICIASQVQLLVIGHLIITSVKWQEVSICTSVMYTYNKQQPPSKGFPLSFLLKVSFRLLNLKMTVLLLLKCVYRLVQILIYKLGPAFLPQHFASYCLVLPQIQYASNIWTINSFKQGLQVKIIILCIKIVFSVNISKNSSGKTQHTVNCHGQQSSWCMWKISTDLHWQIYCII